MSKMFKLQCIIFLSQRKSMKKINKKKDDEYLNITIRCCNIIVI